MATLPNSDITADLVAAMPDIARALLGEPNRHHSRATELRYGTHGSLSIDLAKGVFHDKEAGVGGGVIDLVVRERGGTRPEAVEWLQENGFLKAPAISKSVGSTPQRTFYDYCDADGVVRYRVERRNGPEGKTFRQHGPDGRGGFISAQGCMKGVEPLPYNLDTIVDSDADDAPIYVVEGEKDADRLTSLGLIATCNSGGANKWPDAINHWFTGRRVVIIADNDKAGRDHAADVASKLRDIAASVVVVDLPDLPQKGDVSDWLDRGGTLTELDRLIDEAARAGKASGDPDAISWLHPADWQGQDAPPRLWAWKDWLPWHQATPFTGPAGSGKSLLAQQGATCSALGRALFDIEMRESKAAYITWEDDADELWRRQKAICDNYNVEMEALRDRLLLLSLHGVIGSELATFDTNGLIHPTKTFARLRDSLIDQGVQFAVLDNVAHIFAGDENKRHQVTAFMNLMNGLAKDIDGAVVILAHPNKGGDEYSGSTAWENNIRARMNLARPTDEDGTVIDSDARILTRSKANYAKRGEGIEILWHNWSFILPSEMPANALQKRAETIQAATENEIFMQCLAACTKARRAVSHSPSSNYAPKVFASMTEAKRLKRPAFEKAMERLIHLGKIELDVPLWQGTNRHWKTGIRAVENLRHTPAPDTCATPELSDCNSLRQTAPNTHPITKVIEGAPPAGQLAPSSFEESETDFAASNEAEF